MKNRILPILLILAMLLGSLSGCAGYDQTGDTTATESTAPETVFEEQDYAGSLTLDMSSSTAKQEVTVHQFIDGDTTHFQVPDSVMSSGVLKARFVAINTPESTGKIEEFGKAASAFTKERLFSAVSIIIESETESWNPDSTGDRYLVWVWYKTADSEPYRNLNIEILQNGLAIANSSAGSRYGETCVAAINQAKTLKLNIYSGQPDPDYYYGEAVELTLRELRTNIESYNGIRVAFHGTVTMNNNYSVYVEAYDAETNMYYGMSVYYGYGLNGQGLDILTVGNEVRIVGSVQYYEAGGTWQVSDLEYRLMKPDDPNNIQKLSDGHAPAYVLTEPALFKEGTVEMLVNDALVAFPYAQLALSTSIEMTGLYVYTTSDEDSSSKGSMTLYCQVDGHEIVVRTVVLYDENGELITQDRFVGATIDVRGIVDYFDGDYQIKVFTAEDITVH